MASLIPTLCPSCGVPLGTRRIYELKKKMDERDIGTVVLETDKIGSNVDLFEEYGIINYCCRCVITTTVPALHNIRASHDL
jgi:DNA-directed RNA polymerase subunit N (RpoN/RPB10)